MSYSSSNKPQNSSSRNPIRPKQPFIEGIRDLGSGAAESFQKDFLGEIPQDFFNQVFGAKEKKQYSGDIAAGEQLVVNDLYSGKYEENKQSQKQLFYERTLLAEEKALIEKKTGELRMELQQIMQEIQVIATAMPKTVEEVRTAQMQSVVNPGLYHIVFFERMLEFLKSFRRKIEHANSWLYTANRRAAKKSFWSMYKQHGGKYLLSGEHYSQRSAG